MDHDASGRQVEPRAVEMDEMGRRVARVTQESGRGEIGAHQAFSDHVAERDGEPESRRYASFGLRRPEARDRQVVAGGIDLVGLREHAAEHGAVLEEGCDSRGVGPIDEEVDVEAEQPQRVAHRRRLDDVAESGARLDEAAGPVCSDHAPASLGVSLAVGVDACRVRDCPLSLLFEIRKMGHRASHRRRSSRDQSLRYDRQEIESARSAMVNGPVISSRSD